MLHDPLYAYGQVLEPAEQVVGHVLALNVELADRQKELKRPPTLEELDQEYTNLINYLLGEGICRHVADVEPIVPKETWLRAQLVDVQRIVDGKDRFE